MVNSGKIKVIIVFLLIGMILISGCLRGSDIKTQLKQQFSDFEKQYNDKLSQGYDVTGADQFISEAKQNFNKNNYTAAKEFLDKAIDALGKAQKSGTNAGIRSTPGGEMNKDAAAKKLASIKIASQYRYVTDGLRSVDDVIKILSETRTQFINLGWARLDNIPDKCSDLTPAGQTKCDSAGNSYEYLTNAISKIKNENPDIIFGGALSAEFLNPETRNEQTGENFGREDTWKMALDPSKWGIQMSKEDFQTRVAVSHGWAVKGQPYDPKSQMPYYFPDQTNPDYQKLFLSWVYKQIDCGVDVILIDINTKQAKLLTGVTGNANSIAVTESFDATSNIVDQIHNYGLSKGRYVYVISWATATDLESALPAQKLDAVMTTPSTDEIKALKMDEAKWDSYISGIKQKFGDIPIFVMFDQGPDYRPFEAFSQELSPADQQKFLRIADEFYQQKGLVFIYPIHGGIMGSDQRLKLRAYGKYNWYDSMAPEFQTYETIKELALKKAVNST